MLIVAGLLAVAFDGAAQNAGKKHQEKQPLLVTVLPPDKREPSGLGSQIVRVNADGSDRKALTSKEEFCGDPALAPDGKRIAFVVISRDDKSAGLYVMNADGTGRQRLVANANLEADILAPRWSPDGKRIAFCTAVFNFKSPSLTPRLYLVDPDGRNLKRLEKADGLMPAWSPEGKRLLFTREEDGGRDAPSLCACDLNGSDVRQVVKQGPMMGAWSPDGKWLAYVVLESLHVRGEAAGLFLARADGSGSKRLAGGADAVCFGVHWAADSKRIFFTRLATGKGAAKDDEKGPPAPAVHVIDTDGRNLQRVNSGDEPAYVGGTYLLASFMFRR
jgi:dipeptidyl aminopeptidase/acylaminoacyl peptidase